MRVLFIYPDLVTPTINFCPAVHVLSAVLKQAGHETALIHVNQGAGVPFDRETIIHRAREARADLIGMTATSFNYPYAEQIAQWLAADLPEVPRVLGGSHATITPEDFADSHFDAFCIGEGEEPLQEMLAALGAGRDWRATSNLVVRDATGNIRRNPVRGFFRDLDALPFCDFDITDTPRILQARQAWLSISFSRGCPYECTFCINHIYKRELIGPHDKMGQYLRRRSPENCVAELEHLARTYPGQIAIFNFDDDLLPMDKPWMREFGALYRRRVLEPFGIKYAINCRATYLDDDLGRLFSESGCHEVRIGFETGSEELRRQVLGKPVRDVDLIRAFAACDRYGVVTNAFTMMGIPDESPRSFAQTLRMVLRLKPYLMRMTFLHPYAHTKIYDTCVQRKLQKPVPVHEDSFTESPLRFEHLSDAQIFCFRFLFPWYLNAHWFGAASAGQAYRDLVAEFEAQPLERLKQSVPEIIRRDAEASRACDRPHFRYFKGNAYYFELAGKYDARGRAVEPCKLSTADEALVAGESRLSLEERDCGEEMC